MSWVKWFKARTGKPETPTPGGQQRIMVTGSKAQPKRRRKGAYAREWVRILEDNDPARRSSDTWSWALEDPGATATGQIRRPSMEDLQAAVEKAADADTFAWELHETDSADDPWGLERDAPKPPPTYHDGVNPYDTGVFDATWTGKFDRR